MANFRVFQAQPGELEAFAGGSAQPAPDQGPSIQAYRAARNEVRLKNAKAEIQAEALRSKAAWRDFSVLTRDKQNIIARVYRPAQPQGPDKPLPVYIYFHGGGFLFGTAETDDAFCMRIAAGTGILVISVAYRHTPEYKHPTQFNDAWDAFVWLAEEGATLGADTSRVVVGGMSAGAALAASIALRQNRLLQDGDAAAPKVMICGQLLGVPWLMHMDNRHSARDPAGSLEQNKDAPVLPNGLLRLFTDLLDVIDPEDPLLNAAVTDDSNVVGLPKSSLLIAGRDPFRDEGLIYAQKLEKIGVPTRVCLFEGMPHSFRSFPFLPSNERWDEVVFESLSWFIDE